MDKRAEVVEFARHRGVLRPKDMIALGVSPSYFAHLVQGGIFERTARGLYMLREFEATENHGLVEAVRAQPRSVVCLMSALSFHRIGTQVPNKVWVAVPFGSRIARAGESFAHTVIMRPRSYETGIDLHILEGIEIPIYGVAKTIADCFKFRHKIGVDVAIEALREALRERCCSREEIREYALVNRVEKVILPYLEALSI